MTKPETKMYVINRKGVHVPVSYDKISSRNEELAEDLSVDPTELSQSIISGLKSGMTTREIDTLSCESAIHRSIYEPDYGILASRIAWNDFHKNTPSTFSDCIDILVNNVSRGKPNPLISREIYDFAKIHIDTIESTIDYSRDYQYNFFAFCTFQESYLKKVNDKPVERPQHLLMLVSLGMHGPSNRNGFKIEGNIDKALECYVEMSKITFTPASPTLFNSGTRRPQMSSCFVLTCPDSLGEDEYKDDGTPTDGPREEVSIAESWQHCVKISKFSGGLGVDISFVRCRGAYIAGTNSRSDGIIPLIQTYNSIGRYITQGRRKGAISLYLQPWHPDTPEFLEIKTNGGDEQMKAKDIFPALWIPDLFFKRLIAKEDWSFFCPGSYPELVGLYGDEFEKRYLELESQGKYVRRMPIEKLWQMVIKSLEEKGLPYMLAKDSINKKSNHKNIGPIYGSNLCTEIMQYHDPTSIAVCNLSSLSLPAFVTNDKMNGFDFIKLGKITELVVENLNSVLNRNFSPVRHCAKNNLSLRPIGVGVQGLADAFILLHLPWESLPNNEKSKNAANCTKKLNQLIFEYMYFFALLKSSKMAKEFGSYSRFEGSPTSQGILQFDMWGVTPLTMENVVLEYEYLDKKNKIECPKLDWVWLKERVKEGLYNSLLIAPMPTSTTSQIIGNCECFEPYTSNLFSRKVQAGTFPVINRHLYRDLRELGMLNRDIINEIIDTKGSIQTLNLPDETKNIYKTVWEISWKTIVDFAADRGAFIDQSQSMNIYMKHPTMSSLSTLYVYGWKKGLKTLSYYTRSTAGADPASFHVIKKSSEKVESEESNEEKESENKKEKKETKTEYVCNEDVCMACSG